MCLAVFGLVLAAGGTSDAGAAPVPVPARLVTITIPAPAGEVPSQWLNYAGPPRADVLLPAGYDPDRRYPLLVLLSGLGGNYEWFEEQGLLAPFDDLGAIVVMPEGGPGGWYADWWNGGERGGPAWESYELDQVLPTIAARYPILPQRRYHAIAGFSMGGLGAVYLAGRLPGFFGSAASLSGFVDPQFLAPVIQPAMGVVSGASEAGDHNLNPVYGPPYGFYADGHNPARLTMNLKQTRVFETTGTGIPDRGGLGLLLDGATTELADGTWEEGSIIFPMSQLYHQALLAAGVDVTYEVHTGGHDLPDFLNEIRSMLAWGLFNPGPDDASDWTNDTVATHGQLWDVGYAFAQAPGQVVQFHQQGMHLSISAAGSSVTITTSAGCAMHTDTPATIELPTAGCGS